MGIRFVGQWKPIGRLKVHALNVTPVFTSKPIISPTTGPMGTLFTATPAKLTGKGTVTGQWYLNGVVVNGQTSLTYTSDGTGSLTFRNTAVIQSGTITATSDPATITASQVVQHAPTWQTQPGLLGTFAEATSVSIPIMANDQENNISTYTITNGQLPNGLSMNLFTGLISGTLDEVTQDTSYSFEITVTDRTNLTLKGTFTINVANVKTTVTWQTDNSQAIAMPAPGEPVNVQLGATSN